MRLSRFLCRNPFQEQQFFSNAEKLKRFLDTNTGKIMFLGLLAPVVAYPITSLFCFGPLIGTTFKLRYSVDRNLPEHLQKIIDEV